MKQLTSKVLSLLLSLALLCGLCVPAAFAAESRYSDTRGHWAEDAIERWSGYGVIQGYGDTFRPDASITRAQMAKILSNTLGLTETDGNPFSDVAEDAWYAPYVLRCYAAGILTGDNEKANPDAVITRQQAMVMLGRALGITPEKRPDLSAFADGGEVGAWAAPYVAAMVDSGIVGGVGNGRLAPGGTMTRAALVTVLDRAVVQYIQAPGSYELENEDGIILVATGKVTLSGKTSADILVSPAADGKALAFDKATVKGNITVQADDAKITVKDSKLPDITLTGKGSKVTEDKPATGSTSSGGSHGGGGGSSTPAYSNLTITDSKAVSSGTYQNVTITDAVGDGDVTLSGLTARGNLYIHGGGSNSVKLENCTILGKIIMAKASGQPPRLHLTNTPVTYVETQKPAIIEAADATSAVTVVEAKANVEVKGENTTVAAVTVPAAAESAVEVKVSAGTVTKVEARSAASITGAANSVGTVVAEASVTVASDAVEKVEVPSNAENVTVNVQGNSAIEVQADSVSTKIAADNAENVTVSGTAKDDVTTHTHSWGDGEVTKQPTCAEEGVKTYTCTVEDCPIKTKTEVIAKVAHMIVTDEAEKADCLTPGKTEGSHCSVCGEVLKVQEEIAPLGHDFTGAYTYDENLHWHDCVRCHNAYDEELPHTYDSADCAQPAPCTVCGYEKPAGQHIWDQGEVTTAATCTEAGVKTYTCTACGTTKTEKILALGHDYAVDFTVDKAATCTEAGSKSRHCVRCDVATDVTEIPAIGHTWGDWVNFDADNHKHTCSVCRAEETAAHAWDNGVITTPSTETEEGVKTYTCSACQATKPESIPVISAKTIWFSDPYGNGTQLYLNWTEAELSSDERYYFGSQPTTANNMTMAPFMRETLTGITESQTIPVTIEAGPYNSKRVLYTSEEAVKVTVFGTAPSVSVIGQADGTYKIENADSSYHGKYLFLFKNPDGDVIWSNVSHSGTMSISPWDGCTIEVRTIDWTISDNTQSVAFTLSPVTTVTEITLCTAPSEVKEVSTYDELLAALQAGGTVRLTQDIQSTNVMMLNTGADATLELNGYTLDIPDLRTYYGKHLTIDGSVAGSKVCYSSGTNTLYATVYSYLTITGGGTYQNITNDRSVVTITGGTFTVDPTRWVDTAAYDVIKNESDGTWTVSAK